jgi:hypothetical protein
MRWLGVCITLLLVGSFGIAQEASGPPTLEGLLGKEDVGIKNGVASAGAQRPIALSGLPAERPRGTLTRPVAGVRHPDLDQAWATYDAALAKGLAPINEAISRQFDVAAASGNLDNAEKCQRVLTEFERTGVLPQDTRLMSMLAEAIADLKDEHAKLQVAYEGATSALTRQKKLVEARAVRDEWAGLATSLHATSQSAAGQSGIPLVWQHSFTATDDLVALTATQASDLVATAKKIPSGRRLRLNGLTTLSDEAARTLAQHKGDLSLDGLTTLSNEAAEALAQHKGDLSLNGLTALHSVELATKLARQRGLSLNGLTTLSGEVAEALSQHKLWFLSLNGLTMLSDEAARTLSHHEGDLSLNGLTMLTDEAAKALSQHKRDLSLNGLTMLTDEAAKALSQHKGDLSLDGLTTLSDEAAEALSHHVGHLSLYGLTTLSPEAAQALRAHRSIALPDKFKR